MYYHALNGADVFNVIGPSLNQHTADAKFAVVVIIVLVGCKFSDINPALHTNDSIQHRHL